MTTEYPNPKLEQEVSYSCLYQSVRVHPPKKEWCNICTPDIENNPRCPYYKRLMIIKYKSGECEEIW